MLEVVLFIFVYLLPWLFVVGYLGAAGQLTTVVESAEVKCVVCLVTMSVLVPQGPFPFLRDSASPVQHVRVRYCLFLYVGFHCPRVDNNRTALKWNI